MEYIIISDIKELTSIEAIAGKDTIFVSPNCFTTPSLKINFLEYAG